MLFSSISFGAFTNPYVRKLAAISARAAARVPLLRRPLQGAYDRYFTRVTGPHVRLFSGIYPDFRAAMQAIPATRLVGYDNVPSASRQSDDMFRIYAMDYPILFWLDRLLADCRLLFDWGGNTGVSYFSFRRLLRYPHDFTWLVNDVPAVVREGMRIMRLHAAPGLEFTTTLEGMCRADILLAAGVLHFIEDPFDLLRRQAALPAHVLLNKVPVYSLPNAVTLQNMGTALLPNHLFNETDLVNQFIALGYRQIDAWETDLACHIPFHPQHSIRGYKGYYFARADDSCCEYDPTTTIKV